MKRQSLQASRFLLKTPLAAINFESNELERVTQIKPLKQTFQRQQGTERVRENRSWERVG